MTDQIPRSTHIHWLKEALELAKKSPPKPTNFRVGCVIVSYPTLQTLSSTPSPIAYDTSRITTDVEPQPNLGPHEAGIPLSTGFTLELAGNQHAEQVALTKLLSISSGRSHGTEGYIVGLMATSNTFSLRDLNRMLAPSVNAVLYTTLEPCAKRLSGEAGCVSRIINTRTPDSRGGIRKVVFGAKEPGTFVQDSQSCEIMTQNDVEWEYIPDLEAEILDVAKAGHTNTTGTGTGASGTGGGGGTNVDDISPEERKRQESLPRNPKKRMMEFFRRKSNAQDN